jgi:hypothetical protein
MMPLEYLNIKKCIETPPPPLDFVIPGFLAGTVGGVVAPGGTGKSWLALQIAASVAGSDTLAINPPASGRVLYLAGEDPVPVLHSRIHTLSGLLNPGQRDEIIERLHVSATLGKSGDLLDDGQTADAISRAGEECRLIIIDTLSRWHTGEENSRKDAAAVMRRLESIAGSTGASILYLHHTSKAATLEGNGDRQQAGRGSSVFVDEARFLMTMQTCTESEGKEFGISNDMRGFFVKTTLAKTNYCSPEPPRWFRKREGGMLEPVEIHKPGKPGQKNGGKGGDDDDF